MIINSVSILFPFRGDGGWRDRIFAKVRARYEALLPDAQICVGENSDEPFSRSGARNAAFEQATGDILIVNDADTFCSAFSLDLALDLVSTGDEKFVLPYDVYYNVNEEWTERWLTGTAFDGELPLGGSCVKLPETGYEHRLLTAESGVLVLSREAWEEANGYDERFIGYGWEDNAFITALTRANGRGLKLRGIAYHLYHELAGDPFQHPWKEHNRALNDQYGRHAWRSVQ